MWAAHHAQAPKGRHLPTMGTAHRTHDARSHHVQAPKGRHLLTMGAAHRPSVSMGLTYSATKALSGFKPNLRLPASDILWIKLLHILQDNRSHQIRCAFLFSGSRKTEILIFD